MARTRSLDMMEKDLRRMAQRVKALQAQLPMIGGTLAKKQFQRNFDVEGFIKDGRVNKWKKRVPSKRQNKVLTDRTVLRNSILARKVSGGFAVGVDLNKVPYAKLHNEGGKVTVTPKMKKYFWAMYSKTGDELYKRLALKKPGSIIIMPKRQYMGYTKDIDKAFGRELTARLNKIFI